MTKVYLQYPGYPKTAGFRVGDINPAEEHMTPKKVNPAKTSVISRLSDLIKSSKSVAIVDYQGLKVSQATQLRQAVRLAGGQFVVAKNTLFKIASGIKDLDLSGTSAFVFSKTDEISALKAVAGFAKKNNLPTFKQGLMGDRVLTAEEISILAALPDRNTQYSQLVSRLNSPISKLVYSLNWNISKLVRTLDAVREVKS
ncbi:MAG: 50S ribosomal protein L10 [Candidatus Amesbacteria bacterium GW2011_GWB1_47_19]|nr:MAG: 50S ribosomal protein L10 [Candidatus Amesbacteria bacterium GW2011_GWA1_44_24]KKU31506.1 MAG: 50S ribosomal protein L10 [Candidatus Amesbacteria bacterium GW2011_GWC1_46_24]KKU67514.1 MAG: 50S ribosomal protein L10 [Candidatus Amesbacteria bacterium GW2011_GWB1_47_19]